MMDTKPTLPAETGGAEVTRFNALRHGVLSRYSRRPSNLGFQPVLKIIHASSEDICWGRRPPTASIVPE
jgi:hypothetical protein